MDDFSGQVVLVTGASRGIGHRVAVDFAARGARVIMASRSLAELEAEAARLSAQGQSVQAVRLDVADAGQVKESIGRLLESLEKIDILVNNAGITRDGLLMRMKDEDWRQVLETNLDGTFRVTREVIPAMIRQRFGRIINITSVVGQMGNAGQSNYVASKAAVIGFTKALARELASRQVTVNAVAPGYIDTDMTAALGEKAREELQKLIPLKRVGSCEDVAFGVRFLASKEAGYITGHVLNINGGMYM